MTDKTEELVIDAGSDNVFGDLGLENAPGFKLKSAIVGQINSIIQHRHLTQAKAAELLGVPQPKISALANGKLHGFSLEKLLGMMLKLGRNVEIGFHKASPGTGPCVFLGTENGRATNVA